MSPIPTPAFILRLKDMLLSSSITGSDAAIYAVAALTLAALGLYTLNTLRAFSTAAHTATDIKSADTKNSDDSQTSTPATTKQGNPATPTQSNAYQNKYGTSGASCSPLRNRLLTQLSTSSASVTAAQQEARDAFASYVHLGDV